MERSAFIGFLLWICLPVSKFINRINWRFGRPYNCTTKVIELLKTQLQPGMVILTHKNYECSSLFIPGYWTHAAMVVSSNFIIDATRKGVCINRIESFLSKVDDFIILKPGFCCIQLMKKASDNAVNLAGLPFSFEFRNSGNAFYCSGLICSAYVQSLHEMNTCVIPNFLRDFIEGYIIKPEDFYKRKDLWQVLKSYSFSVIGQATETVDKLN